MLAKNAFSNSLTSKKHSAFISIIAFLFLFSSFSNAQTNGNTIVSEVVGYATITGGNGEVSRLSNGDSINEGDTISTGKDSSIDLLLPNGRTVVVGPLQTFLFSLEIASNLPSAPNLGSGQGQTLSKSTSPLSAATSAGGTAGSPVE